MYDPLIRDGETTAAAPQGSPAAGSVRPWSKRIDLRGCLGPAVPRRRGVRRCPPAARHYPARPV